MQILKELAVWAVISVVWLGLMQFTLFVSRLEKR